MHCLHLACPCLEGAMIVTGSSQIGSLGRKEPCILWPSKRKASFVNVRHHSSKRATRVTCLSHKSSSFGRRTGSLHSGGTGIKQQRLGEAESADPRPERHGCSAMPPLARAESTAQWLAVTAAAVYLCTCCPASKATDAGPPLQVPPLSWSPNLVHEKAPSNLGRTMDPGTFSA
jgi:hypothetical protein